MSSCASASTVGCHSRPSRPPPASTVAPAATASSTHVLDALGGAVVDQRADVRVSARAGRR